MRFLNISQITVPENRQRRHFDEKRLEELREDILLRGLFHPLLCKNVTSEGATLVAGERRYRCLKELGASGKTIKFNGEELPLGQVPVVTLGEVSELEALEAEYSENAIRTDLTWQEQLAAKRMLHELRLKQTGGKQSVIDTATELLGGDKRATGAAVTRLQQELVVAQHLDDPEVASAPSIKDAAKIIEKRKRAEHHARLAQEFDLSASEHTLIRGDMRREIEKLPSGEFDVILTDPPYGIDADDFGEQATTTHDYDDSYEYWLSCIDALVDHSARITKPKAHAYIFCDIRRFDEISIKMQIAGWDVWHRPIIWSKGNGMLPRPHHCPKNTYECILYAIKGDRRVIKEGMPDVINVPADSRIERGAQKPVALYVDLLSRSANPGDKVVDLFAGTGVIFPAASQCRCVALGIERSGSAADVAQTRMMDKVTAVDPVLGI